MVSGENANKKKAQIEWNEECQESFNKLKQLCSQTPVLAYANYKKPVKLHTHASENGLGAVLYRKQDDGTDHVIAYASWTLSKSEKNYDAHKLEFLALKWSVTERFHEYLYGGEFEVYTDNNPLTYILTTAKLDATGQRWVASLANYNFKIFYRSGKLNVEADALSRIPWKSTQVDHLEPLIVQTVLQSMLEIEMGIPEKYSPLNVIQKEMLVNSTPKLTEQEWVKEQLEDVDIGTTIQLLQTGKLGKYVAKEVDSSGMQVPLKYRKDLFLKNWLLYQKVMLKNHSEQISQFVLPKNIICKVILACHDDSGHLGMERTLGLLQEWFFWLKMAEEMQTHICNCDQCLKFKQTQEKSEMQPILVSYPLELEHLDFLTLGGKTDDSKSINVHFTKYAQAYVTPKQTAVIVAKTVGKFPSALWMA